MSIDRRASVVAYLEAVANRDADKLAEVLHPNVDFRGPYMSYDNAAGYMQALKRLGAVLLRNDVKKIFVDGDEACVIYDFVTNTPAGAVPMVEWLAFEGAQIRSVRLYFDRETFGPARAEAGRFAQPVPGPTIGDATSSRTS